jgi:DNA-binding LytR/AlgR family response regulator
VVFVTAFSRYAPEAFAVDASDYVLKPFSDRRFSEALHRAKRRVRERRLGAPAQKQQHTYAEHLSFRHDDGTIVIKTEDVHWIEAEDYYVRIHSNRGRHLVRTALATLEESLNPREFLRVHRGAIVNVAKVAEVRDAGPLTLVLVDGTEIPVSRSRKAAVASALMP